MRQVSEEKVLKLILIATRVEESTWKIMLMRRTTLPEEQGEHDGRLRFYNSISVFSFVFAPEAARNRKEEERIVKLHKDDLLW